MCKHNLTIYFWSNSSRNSKQITRTIFTTKKILLINDKICSRFIQKTFAMNYSRRARCCDIFGRGCQKHSQTKFRLKRFRIILCKTVKSRNWLSFSNSFGISTSVILPDFRKGKKSWIHSI